jgi:glycosyltransferase involved in cell wall biosynthesis
MGLPFIIKIIDFHGVVPEEFFYNGDVHEAKIFGKIEKKVVKKADHLIVVTKAMQRHIEEKYDTLISGQFITLPIFSERLCSIACQKDYSQNEQPVIVYAGGLQKWQQLPKMIEAIKDTAGDYRFKIFSPEPEKVKPMLPESLTRSDLVEIDTKTHDELIREYREANFGFILREDTVVNRVACPTKLIEYLAMGIIPIVDYEDIGDFKALGMSYIRLSDLLEKNIPKNETFTQMITTNHGVFTEIMDIYIQGVSELIKVLKITT